MPHNWGDRYFEGNPSERDVEDTRNNNTKQPRFHQVFGNRKHRTFQQSGPSRGRGSGRGRGRGLGRGRGRGRGRGHGNGSGNGNGRRHGRERGRGRGNHLFTSRSRTENFDENVKDGEYEDGEINDSDEEWRDTNGQTRERENIQEDRDGQQAHEGGPEEHLPIPENDEARIFGRGKKRPRFDVRNSNEGRRKKKYVPGGLIPKFKRIDEYHGETFCDICNESFRDVNAKALHDRSRKHRRQYGYVRHENKKKSEDESKNLTNTSDHTEADNRKRLEEGTQGFLSFDMKNLPKAFQDWANRSLIAAKAAAQEAQDPSLLQAVQREVVDVYRVNDENCTLRRVCWTRRELASGLAYRLSEPKVSALPVIPDSNVRIKEVKASKADLLQDGTEIAKSKKEDGEKKQQEPKDVEPHSTSPTRRAAPRDIVTRVGEDVSSATPTVNQYPPNKDQSTARAPVLQPEHPQYISVDMRWRPSRAAERFLFQCETRNKTAVLAKYYDAFGMVNDRMQDSHRNQAELEPIESVMRTYRELCLQYESEEYDYDELMDRLSTVAKQLEERGKRQEQLRQIRRIQTHMALQAGEFRDCFEPCSKFVRTLQARTPVRGKGVELVGHWFVSLLFKNKHEESRKGFSPTLQIAQEMRNFPAGAMEDLWVYEAAQSAKAVLANNWCGFFGRSMSSIAHGKGSGTSKQMLEGLVLFMREKALIVMTHMNIHFMRSMDMAAPQDIRIEVVRKLLGWDSSDDLENSLAEAKEFVTSLPQPFEVVSEDDASEWIRWKGKSDNELKLSGESDAREDMLTKLSKPIVLEDE